MVTRSERHVATLRALGADEVLINGATPDWPGDGRRLTDQIGAAVAVNVAGGATLTQSIAATRIGGLVHLVGFAADTTAKLDIFTAIRQATTIHVATAGSRESFEAFVRAAKRHTIRPFVAKVFVLEHIRDASSYLGEGGHLGKSVLS